MLRHLATTAVGRVVGGARGSYSRLIAGHNSRWVSAYSTEGSGDGDDEADKNEGVEVETRGPEDGDAGDAEGENVEAATEGGAEGDEAQKQEGDSSEDVVATAGGGGDRGGNATSYKLPPRFTGLDYGLIDVDDELIDWQQSDVPIPELSLIHI